jgi:hypothetical protein
LHRFLRAILFRIFFLLQAASAYAASPPPHKAAKWS